MRRARMAVLLGGAIVLRLMSFSGLDVVPPAGAGGLDPGPTPAEQTDFATSPSYVETMDYLRALAAGCPHIELGSFGYTTEGRPLPVVFVRDHANEDTSWEDGSGKPVVMINAGIHSGEICGKDAILMLLRDIARGHEPDILTHLRLIVVPIFNLDGHERESHYHRFTQVGPEDGFGTRRNALRLDLNRDFMKLETPEGQALVRLFSQFQPQIFVDLHTNDGFDHQYDLLYGISVDPTLPGRRDFIVREMLLPAIEATMLDEGYRGHPIAYPRDEFDISAGIATYGITPYLATGFAETRLAISVLSEAHPYVPYARRVGASLALLRGILRCAVRHRIEITETVARARGEAIRWAREPGLHEIGLGASADTTICRPIRWLGKSLERVTSAVTGRDFPRYHAEKIEVRIPFYDQLAPSCTTRMPRGYLILRPWRQVVENLRLHSIDVATLSEAFQADVESYRFESFRFAPKPYQGHHRLEDWEGAFRRERREFPPGTYWVPLDQPGGVTAMHLLEPESDAGLLRWNYFDTIFERGIILEDWALEENALRLLADPAIRAEYAAALADSAFAADPDARLEFFFQKTPYVEEGERLYPVFRVMGTAPERLQPS